jgi:hypothetical protein
MPTTRYTGPPMSLGNMRENRVRSRSLACRLDECRQVPGRDSGAVLPQPRPALAARSWRQRAAELERAPDKRKPSRGQCTQRDK